MKIRPEQPSDAPSIDSVIEAAFAEGSHTHHQEAAIVRALRAAGDLSVSLVAEADQRLHGHIAFSPVRIDGDDRLWFGLGPLAVRPESQKQGVGTALVRHGLETLHPLGADGCVVLGKPGFYGRFGFVTAGVLHYRDVPRRFTQCCVFRGEPPSGALHYVRAFDLAI